MHFRLMEQMGWNTHASRHAEKSEPVKLEGVSLPPALMEILSKFGDAGFTDNLVFGGALRDSYRGKGDEITEIDLAVSFDALMKSIPDDQQEGKFLEIINRIPGVSECEFSKEDPYFGAISGGRATAEYKAADGKIYILDINLYEWDELPSSPEMALLGDAPINSIAMGKDGEIWAHHDFKNHLENKIYSFMGDDIDYYDGDKKAVRSDVRYEKTAAKIPGLEEHTHYFGQRRPGGSGMGLGGMRIVTFDSYD